MGFLARRSARMLALAYWIIRDIVDHLQATIMKIIAILAPATDIVDKTNAQVMSKMPVDISSDSICKMKGDVGYLVMLLRIPIRSELYVMKPV
ncbi:hypothetical protein OROMI_015747 [Orobanche minor]